MLAQGLDQFYLKQGEEYLAYEKVRTARINLETSQDSLAAAQEDLPDAYTAFDKADYDLTSARESKDRERFETAKAAYDEAKSTLDRLVQQEADA